MKSSEDTFRLFDEEKKGFLDKFQTKCALLYFTGEEPSAGVREFIRECGNQVKFSDFAAICERTPRQTEAERVAEVFTALSGGKGFVAREDFDSVCEKYAKFLSPTARRDLFAEMDANADGRVTLRDLSRCLNYPL